jgi:hypothetical protein
MFVSKHITFLEKEFVLKMSSERKIKFQELTTDIQIKPNHEAITSDVQPEAQEI